MSTTDLQQVAESIVRRAEQRGYVVPREIRTALTDAGLSSTLWKDIVALARPPLRYRNGRYYHDRVVSASMRTEQDHQRGILRAVRHLTRAYRSLARSQERREHQRSDFVLPVEVHTESGGLHTLLSRDISATGIRLVGTRRLLGQKVKVIVTQPGAVEGIALPSAPRWTFVVRILWTCAVGQDLFENGGVFLEVANLEANEDGQKG